MIELSIPQAGETTKNAKDLVFSILAERQPLSNIQIVNHIHGHYNVGLTYQAVKKAIDSLIEKDVLIKEGKMYSINKDWLLTLKKNVDGLLRKFGERKHPTKITSSLAKEQYAVYTFNNLIDLDNFWGELLIFLADRDKPDVYITVSHFTWWLLINLGNETKIFTHFRDVGLESYNINYGDYPINRWAQKYYGGLGLKSKLIPKTEDETISINVIGDTVIQVDYPKETIDRIRNIFSKYDSVMDLNQKEVAELVHEHNEVKFSVIRNKEIADSMKKKYLALFK